MKLIAFVLLVFCSGCGSHATGYVKMANQISFDYSKIVRREDNLILSSYGGGFLDAVNFINLSFNISRLSNIIEARQLIVHKVEEYLSMINSCDEIRPYLNNYPFDGKNVNLSIGFFYNDEFANPPYVAHAFVQSGIVYYSTYDCANKRLEDLYSELYEEALRLVQEHDAALCDRSIQ